MEFYIQISAPNVEFIPEFTDENLFEFFKDKLLTVIENPELIYFGIAPDNTADNNDNLLLDGVYFRIIASENLLNINLESTIDNVINGFKNILISKYPFWGTVIEEKGFIKKETTIEFLYL